MAKSWLEEYGIEELADKLGKGAPIGALIGGSIALLGALFGVGSGSSWLAWLAVPIAAMVGGTIGDYIKKDGPVFGEHGVVKSMGNHFKEKTIPEGYIAASIDAETYALDSNTLSISGDVHGLAKTVDSIEKVLGYKESRDLDSFVEFNIKNDPRLRHCS